MKTPNKYITNLKKHIITEEMLSDCLYSVNKRAKNCRNQARSYEHSYHWIHAASCGESYRNKEDEYYQMKESLLKMLSPVCIHHELLGYAKIRTYSYQKDYRKKYAKASREDLIVWENSYYDYESDSEVYFFDVEDKTKPKENYYLFYELLDHSYHSPIEKEDIEKYPELEVVHLSEPLRTNGYDETKLISVQFVRKVIRLIESGKYQYISSKDIKENPLQ